MFWIVFSVVMLIVAAGGVIGLMSATSEDGKTAAFFVLVLSLGIWGIVTGWQAFARVETGHVGIVRQFGRIEGQINPGVSFIAPWKSYDSINVQIQKKTFEKMNAFSSETQNVYMTSTINYSILPKDVQALISDVGTDWFDRLVPNNMNQAFKDETVKYAATDIAPHRESIRQNVLAELRKRLSTHSIRVNDLNIENIAFSEQFEQAIEAKQEATQSALRAKAQVQQAEFEAQSKVAEAKGTADANVTVANGQAEANRKLNASLSPEILQYIAIQKLADNVTIALLPSGSGSLIDPTKLLQGATAGK